MNNHREDNIIPPFRIRVLKQFQDCLSRQVGEAVAILMSKDSLLNSKNEYIANCISRVSIEEGAMERKMREIREEEEERKETEKFEQFKFEKKRFSNQGEYRKDNTRANESEEDINIRSKKKKREAEREDLPEGWKSPKRSKVNIAPTPEDMEPYMENWLEWWDQATSSCQKAGRLAELRERMRKERENIALRMDRITAERKKAAFVKSFFSQNHVPNEQSAVLAEQSANTAPALAEQDVCTPSRRKTEIVSENMSNHTAEFKGGSGIFLIPKRKLQFQQTSKGAENSPTKRRKYDK